MQMKKVKEEKGSMAVYVAIALSSFLVILTALCISSSSIRNTQLTTIMKIKESYEQGNDRIDETYQKIVEETGYFEDFIVWNNYAVTATADPTSIDGILTLTATGQDANISMNNVTAFSPRDYPYLDVKYKVDNNSDTNTMKFTFDGTSLSKTLRCDGQWHTATFDLASSPDIWRQSTINGWQWNWTSENGTTMQIDYIRVHR